MHRVSIYLHACTQVAICSVWLLGVAFRSAASDRANLGIVCASLHFYKLARMNTLQQRDSLLQNFHNLYTYFENYKAHPHDANIPCL